MNRCAFDLRLFLTELERREELHHIPVPVDRRLEIARITDRVSKAYGPALFFSAPQPASLPLLTNLFGSHHRAALALGGQDLQPLVQRLTSLLQGCSGSGEERLTSLCRQVPEKIVTPLWEECSGKLADLPFLQSWSEDGGGYLTLPLIVTRHPESGVMNWGVYRVQESDNSSMLIHWKEGSGAAHHARAWHERGEAMPVAVVLGAPPALLWAATAPLPQGVDEAAFVGLLADEALPLSRCTDSDLLVPAVAEAVLEGTVAPGDCGLEGPFGNHSGSYSPAANVPRWLFRTMHHRHDCLCPATIVGPPPMEDCYLAALTPRLLLPLLQIDFPEIVNLHMPIEGIFHQCALISVIAGQDGLNLLRRLRQTGLLRSSRLIILLPQDVDVHNLSQVFWRVLNAVDPQLDLSVVPPSGLNIDATRPLLCPLSADPQVAALVARRAAEYGLPDSWFD